MFYIVYPEKKTVSEKQIKVWYSDAVANNDMASEFLDAKDVITMARGLHDSGYITLARK